MLELHSENTFGWKGREILDLKHQAVAFSRSLIVETGTLIQKYRISLERVVHGEHFAEILRESWSNAQLILAAVLCIGSEDK